MKHFIYSLIVLFCGLAKLSVKADDNKLTYRFIAEIEGLSKGDTICFEKVILPGWNLEPAFKVVVDHDGEFSYEGSAYNDQYFLMTYKPLSGEQVFMPRRGLFIFTDGGDVRIKGNVESIYYSDIEGGIYDDASIREIASLENKAGKEKTLYMRGAENAILSGDTAKFRAYSKQLESFEDDHRVDEEKLSKMKFEFAEKEPSSILNILDMLGQVTYIPLEKLETYYASIEKKAQKSYYGILLRQEIDNMAMLAPGMDAPDFFVKAIDEQQLSLDDCSGYYVLIYHFGLCAGSLMIDKEVTAFYTENKDKVKVIGVTEEDLDAMKDWYEKINPSEMLMNIELKPALGSMVSHPWTDIKNEGDNRQLAIDYAFSGYPFFVFISPEGKILARGFQETFYEAKSIVEAEK